MSTVKTSEEHNLKINSPLEKRKVVVTPILRDGRWLQDNHDGAFMYTGTKAEYCVPYDLNSRQFNDPLTIEEREWLESDESGLALEKGALSVHKPVEKNFWSTFNIKLDKHGLTLDLSNPMDFIRYKVLLSNTDKIAPNWDSRFELGTYKFALVDEDFKMKKSVKKSENMQKIYMEFGKISSYPNKMRDFLMVYGLQSTDRSLSKIPSNATIDFLVAEIQKIIDSEGDKFLDIITDSDYKAKALITNAIRKKVISYSKKGYTLTINGNFLGKTLKDVISYINDDINNEDLFIINSKLEDSKESKETTNKNKK